MVTIPQQKDCDMTASFWSMKSFRATATKPKVDTVEKAINKVRDNLQKQLTYWKDGRGKNQAQRALWFKKMTVQDAWMLKVQMQTSAVFLDEESELKGEPYQGPIAEANMEGIIQELIADITTKDENTINRLTDAYNKLQEKKAEQRKERLEKKLLKNDVSS